MKRRFPGSDSDGSDTEMDSNSEDGDAARGSDGENGSVENESSDESSELDDGENDNMENVEGESSDEESELEPEENTDPEDDSDPEEDFDPGYDPDPEHHNGDSSDDSNDDEPFPNFEFPPEVGDFVCHAIRQWALGAGVLSMRKLDSLLARLHRLFPNLPLSYKTLLNTPINVPLIDVAGGKLWYKGIRTNLNLLNLEEFLIANNSIKLDVNMDGIHLFKKSDKKFWPILARLVGSKNKPFVIAIYFGDRDPDAAEYLRDFVAEVHDLQTNGFNFNGRLLEFNIRHYICDAPARAFIKCTVEHGGRFACEKCTVEGEWIENRMTYCDLNAPLRTDHSFENRDQEEHHRGDSPLEATDWGPVSQFRLDPMHLVFLGVYRRVLKIWRLWNGRWKLHLNTVTAISTVLVGLKRSCPCDFNRLPKPLLQLNYYKAHDFRRSLLYECVVAFKDHVDQNLYDHLMLLHCSIYILCSPMLLETHRDLAHEMLILFVTHGAAIYGDKFVVYNVHNLCHLSSESLHGTLDKISAFSYENHLKSIRDSLKCGYLPLQQAANRDIEREVTEVVLDIYDNQVTLSKSHLVQDEIVHGVHFKVLEVNDIVFKCNRKDSCFKTSTGEVGILSNIVQNGNQIFFVAKVFLTYRNVYEYPIPSSDIGIVRVCELENQKRAFPLADVVAKCWLMPLGNDFACFPLVHSTPVLH